MRQAMLLADLGAQVLVSTPSYAVVIAQAIAEAGFDVASLKLELGLFGGEPWTESLRAEIERGLPGLRAVNFYGLSEMCGPGVAAECIEARDGLHAKDLWRERGSEVDLVVSDVVMPQIGGPALKRWIDEQRPHTPTIFMSGYTNSETFDVLLEDTGADFLQKPFTPAELSRRVREVLDRPQRTQNACAAPAPG